MGRKTRLNSSMSRKKQSEDGPILRKRKVSATAMGKWKPVTRSLKTEVMTFLKDSMSRFTGYGEDVDSVLDDIEKGVSHTLKKLKVPVEEDMQRMDTVIMSLLKEKDRLDEMKESLTEDLRLCKSEVNDLEDEIEVLKDSCPS